MKYNNHLNYRKRRSFLIKVRLVLFLLFVVICAGILMFYLKYVREENVNTPNKTTSEATVSVVAPSINIFKSPYFQFQAPNNWVEVPNESTPTKFVYRGLRSSLIEHELVIYVNQIPANISANRVYAALFKNDNTELDPLTISDHCIKATNNVSTMEDKEILFNGVKMPCDSDSRNFTVLAGLQGDDTTLNMIRPDGTTASYAILYTNLRAVPDATEMKKIIETFQTR